MRKRDSLVGRGADVFLTEEPDAHSRRTARAHKATVMVTVYLPPEVNAQLDQVWLQRKLYQFSK